ncbi:hypothetical protein A2962_03730 [Candidatus Woesebacteria bacterium RIFCSPLOWO2_01_FULL_39_61]|uniref:VanZ-like domain-containing protein n=1 Tax=Candidatus Woesebacteria bacterium RIFCSPHIGHO2_02_FULL_39_13 TaxID=1802505 RepID=A0A1F7Z2P7_9BACT|nr:MAG: hypothetical protein A2692_03910 [Candidatus Woesebacteria bacterium RIFCSPHIGHO2_01_FULL_39_95]OGM33801.1 MAG: hypothetical protein A3D01_02420 [Candidatus Woesebacteria bacterium RIFCSPHIGHO2_02_FULL_39_13]OGM38962.1 MAG: hypothetical protein A3E13_04690 [Candidatus Woesebacteria bacterium RIFCSPHIGHO2_12_FULL_40_20]OGM65610.1 MAG: hypothetical protein A2962_03730 [Candidatus Woesebacteria bacterium RIFCSPLOWO2_01_FULL_39_61]OGM72544.1 MAG: hypothetical protein A3H19_01210 [Candidatus
MKNKPPTFFGYWFPVILWALVIYLFSSYPTAKASEIHWKDFVIKKTAHVIEYAVFSILIYRALKEEGIEKKKAGLFAIFTSVFYGLTDELHQTLTPGREPRIRDVFFDTIGSLLAIYLIWKLLPKAPQKLKVLGQKLHLI